MTARRTANTHFVERRIRCRGPAAGGLSLDIGS